jgi:hypothetical protein
MEKIREQEKKKRLKRLEDLFDKAHLCVLSGAFTWLCIVVLQYISHK